MFLNWNDTSGQLHTRLLFFGTLWGWVGRFSDNFSWTDWFACYVLTACQCLYSVHQHICQFYLFGNPRWSILFSSPQHHEKASTWVRLKISQTCLESLQGIATVTGLTSMDMLLRLVLGPRSNGCKYSALALVNSMPPTRPHTWVRSVISVCVA